METKFHLRARAVILQDGQLLVNKFHDLQYTFLPGGHVEDGESIPKALEREIMEELGKPCAVKKYLGVIESTWTKEETQNWDVSHFFEVEVPELDPQNAVISEEEVKNMEFLWIKPEDFEKHNLLPHSLRGLIRNWIRGDQSAWWGSDFN